MPAPLLFVLSGLTQYAGAALAVGLFASIAAPAVAWLRIVVAALVLVGWRRPWRTRWTRRELGVVALFGVVLASMNVTFYVAIDHLPLGTAVAIEFAGPVAVAAVTGRGWRERVAIAIAAVGVVLLAGVSLDAGPDARTGLVAIALAAVFWAAYILLGRRVATARSGGVTGLALAMTAGAVAFAPFLASQATAVLHDASLAAAVVGVGVLSSVIPYAIEQVVLRRVRPATFAVLLALLPATAAVVGAIALHQVPHGLEVLGLLLVSGAIALTARSSDAAEEAPPPA
ncbi:EamA family transporter [Cellulomonas edaphi]|uniref:EamA family transporter n=1 Tax=Cellulomonas edaphi TaxID=3053468 RepID=A0ABT7S5P4_9CELL|nr:EamA family transporter [Cellulomons edaphi]MDM7830299.1 EamA family transporter [Cellulomons edaphi]